ncbi:MAG: SUMF1/EgtB/PvdO family nonheme iron enzyme, partial [Candidatus Zixiibacteriota bacterium]
VNMDWNAGGCIDAQALSDGDTPSGCRQMMGNVWEWTDSDFLPFPGFVPDPYKEYSQPWFGSRKVLKGGSWATRSRMLRNTWRNFYEPHRRDVLTGFRTCPLSG